MVNHFRGLCYIVQLMSLIRVSPPDLVVSWLCPSGRRNSDRVSSWLAAIAGKRAGLTISLVEDGEAAAGEAAAEVEATGIWQNFPVKVGGQKQRSFCRQMPPFLQSSGQRTAGDGAQTSSQLLLYRDQFKKWTGFCFSVGNSGADDQRLRYTEDLYSLFTLLSSSSKFLLMAAQTMLEPCSVFKYLHQKTPRHLKESYFKM